MTCPRVAFFPDSFHEVNGVALTSRQFEAFARRRNLPFLCVRAGDRAQAVTEEGSVWTLELPRGFLSFALEKDLRFDPAYLRHIPLIGEVLERFQPELIHITGLSEIGMLGAGLAHHLEVPLAASWHTNVHEYLVRRSDWFLRLLPERQSAATARKLEDLALATAAFFYSGARVLFAPNPDLCRKLAELTGRPCHLMSRGVDAELFNPSKRSSRAPDPGVAGLEPTADSEPAALSEGTASLPAPKLDALKGHEFTRAATGANGDPALAAEGSFFPRAPADSGTVVLYQGTASPGSPTSDFGLLGWASAAPNDATTEDGVLAPGLPEGAIENSPGQPRPRPRAEREGEGGGSPGNAAREIPPSPVGATEPSEFILGFVGRLSVEKNIALLVDLERELPRLGVINFRFLIVGHGGDEAWLRARLRRAEFTGVLRGEALARAYARMDLFVFPSHTDTFGNAVLEAQSSGVPAIVTPDGGPKTIVRDGETGRVVPDEEFAPAIAAILANPGQHAQMRLAARARAEKANWDAVFESVYAAYELHLLLKGESIAAG